MKGVISLMVFLLMVQIAVADLTYSLVIYKEGYCDCDNDCSEMRGCLTESTDDFIKDLKKDTSSAIEDAEKEGYRGVCAELFFDTNPVPYHMTESCDPLEEQPEENTVDGVTDVGIDLEEDEGDEVLLENYNSNEEGVGNDNSEGGIGTAGSDSDTEKISGLVIADEGKEEGVMLRTPVITSITVIVIGFFGLMGWLAYLLQKK